MIKRLTIACASAVVLLYLGSCRSKELSDFRNLVIEIDSFGVSYDGPANLPDVEAETIDPEVVDFNAGVIDRSKIYTVTIVDTEDQSVVFTGEFNQEGLESNFLGDGFAGFVTFEDVFEWTGVAKTYEATFGGLESTCSPQPTAREAITFTVNEGSRLVQLVFQVECWETTTCEFCY